MGDAKTGPAELPGNHGQFGADIETESYEPLPDFEAPDPTPADPSAPDADATAPAEGGANPGQHQEQGGMRS